MAMLDGETLRQLLKTQKPPRTVKAHVANSPQPELDVGAIMDAYRKYWNVVRECERVLCQMSRCLAAMPMFISKEGVAILRSGMAKPSDWWRVVTDGGEVVNPSNPTMEVAAWDGLEPDANCNCSVKFPVKWLYMTNEELGNMFKEAMENGQH